MAKKKTTSTGVSELNSIFRDEKVLTARSIMLVQAAYRVYSTGCLMLDAAFGKKDPIKGNMGIPERTILEHFGMTQALKSATYEQLAKNILADDPENYVIVLYAEESDMSRWDKIGVPKEHQDRIISLGCYDGNDEENLETAERCLNKITVAVQDPRVKLVVIDSIKALPCQKVVFDADGNPHPLDEEVQLGIRAKMLMNFLHEFKTCNKKAILYMTNQVSDKIQLKPSDLYSNQKFTLKTPGGRTMEFECHVRIEGTTSPIYFKTKHELTDKEIVIGWEVSYRILKNKFCNKSTGRVATARFLFDPELNDMDYAGFDNVAAILTIGEYLTRKGFISEELGIKKGGGGYYTILGQKVQGEEKARDLLRKNKELVAALEREICDKSDWIFDPIKGGKAEEKDIEEMF